MAACCCASSSRSPRPRSHQMHRLRVGVVRSQALSQCTACTHPCPTRRASDLHTIEMALQQQSGGANLIESSREPMPEHMNTTDSLGRDRRLGEKAKSCADRTIQPSGNLRLLAINTRWQPAVAQALLGHPGRVLTKCIDCESAWFAHKRFPSAPHAHTLALHDALPIFTRSKWRYSSSLEAQI